MHYQMLPHARPGGMAGLLELLLDKGGRDDIYRLADDLSFEIDDLLPIVDASQLLGFLKIEEGDAAITESGTEFANSEILRQKELFRDAALANVLLLRQIRRALVSKSDHTVPEDFFLDMLDAGFYLARRGMIALSLEIGEAEMDAFCAAVQEFIAARRPLIA